MNRAVMEATTKSIYEAFEAVVTICQHIESASGSSKKVPRRAFQEAVNHYGLYGVTVKVEDQVVPLVSLSEKQILTLSKASRIRCLDPNNLPSGFPHAKIIKDWDQFNPRAKWSKISPTDHQAARKAMAELYNAQVQRQWIYKQVNWDRLIRRVGKLKDVYRGIAPEAVKMTVLLGQSYIAAYLHNSEDFKGSHPRALLRLKSRYDRLSRKCGMRGPILERLVNSR